VSSAWSAKDGFRRAPGTSAPGQEGALDRDSVKVCNLAEAVDLSKTVGGN
jgi:hypothetical protein